MSLIRELTSLISYPLMPPETPSQGLSGKAIAVAVGTSIAMTQTIANFLIVDHAPTSWKNR